MQIKHAGIKYQRKTKRNEKRNQEKEMALRKIIKQLKKLVEDGKTEDAKKMLSQIYKKLDKAAKSHLIKKNKAARSKSRLTKMINRRATTKK